MKSNKEELKPLIKKKRERDSDTTHEQRIDKWSTRYSAKSNTNEDGINVIRSI